MTRTPQYALEDETSRSLPRVDPRGDEDNIFALKLEWSTFPR